MKKIIHWTLSLAATLGLIFSFNVASADDRVHLVADNLTVNGSVYSGTTNVDANDNVVFNVTVGGASSHQTVLVNLELFADNRTRVAQSFWDNVAFAPGENKSFSLTMPTNLEPGWYGFTLVIFNPGWNGLTHWYKDQQAINVSGIGTPPPDVTLTHDTLSASVAAGTSNTITSYFNNSGPAKNVLIDLELYDSVTLNKVAQKYWDNVTIGAGATASVVWDTPTSLPQGTYLLQVGIFETGWGNLIHWYKDQESFTVTAGTPTPVVMLSSSSQSASGSEYTLTADISNTGSSTIPVLVDLEVYDQAGNKVAQKFFDNFPAMGTSTLNLTTPALSAGAYRFAVGIFNPGWSSLINWYNSVQSFTVN
jgi:hypothetical protein